MSIPLPRASQIADQLLSPLKGMADVLSATTVGLLRRGEDAIDEIELLTVVDDPEAVFDRITSLDGVARTLDRRSSRLDVEISATRVRVWCTDRESAGAVLLHLTGNDRHISALSMRARERGLSFRGTGLMAADGRHLPADTEAAVYEALGLPWIPPEVRYGSDEIRAAAGRTMPQLVSESDIRGDLHMHSTYSDGRDSIAAMVEESVRLGYEYIAITDHSVSSAASRNLTVETIIRQRDEIAVVRERYPQIEILHGCEVDILRDGRLDFPDHVLEPLDLVIASLHDAAGHSPSRLLERYLAAVNHPLVTIISHPSNRCLPDRRGYDLDYDRLFAAAAEHGTIVEIDGASNHLDMDGALARRAVSQGATVSIDSDSHRADTLERYMKLGVLMGRRGWLESRHVLNTRPIGDVRAIVAAKRLT